MDEFPRVGVVIDRDIDATPGADEALRTNMRARVRDLRASIESAGLKVGDVVYDTSTEARLRLVTHLVFAMQYPSYSAAVMTRDGEMATLTSEQIYRVASKLIIYMQACASWETKTLETIAYAATLEDVSIIGETLDSSVPVGDVVEPTPVEGAYEPPAYEDTQPIINLVVQGTARVDGDASFGIDVYVETTITTASLVATDNLRVANAEVEGTLSAGATDVFSLDTGAATTASLTTGSASVTGPTSTSTLTVSEDATIERLYARDCLGVSTMFMDNATVVRNSNWVRVGSFWWRSGDRQPTSAIVAFTEGVGRGFGLKSAPAALIYEVGRRVVLGHAYGAEGDLTTAFPISRTNFIPGCNDFVELEVHISNQNSKGSVSLRSYCVSVA